MKAKMQASKIIFVTISMRGGGTERVISLLGDYYVEHGYDVDIMMIGDNKIEYEFDKRINAFSISEATGGSLKGRIKRITNMRNHIKNNAGSVVIAMGTVAAMFTCLASVGLKNQLIISERNDPNRLNHRPIKSYEKMIRNLLYRKADRVVFQTNMARDCFPEYITKKGTVILNPLSLAMGESDITREHTVISAGRLTEQKNHRLLIDAFTQFVSDDKHADYKLLIFGQGELESDIQSYIEQVGMSGQIIMKGFTNRLHDELRKGGIYVSSSNWEGISNSLAEAMACGIPVVATGCPMGGSAMLIKNKENGLLVPVEDKQALVDAMCSLADDNELYNSVSKQGSRIIDTLDIEVIAKQWEQCF